MINLIVIYRADNTCKKIRLSKAILGLFVWGAKVAFISSSYKFMKSKFAEIGVKTGMTVYCFIYNIFIESYMKSDIHKADDCQETDNIDIAVRTLVDTFETHQMYCYIYNIFIESYMKSVHSTL